MDISPVYSLALRIRNTKAPVWTHESTGYPKMDISHWDAGILYGTQLAEYCVQTRFCNATLWISPPVCSLALRLRNTKVPVWTNESIRFRKWTSAMGTRQFTIAFSLPDIVIQPELLTLIYGNSPLCQKKTSKLLEIFVFHLLQKGIFAFLLY